MTMDIHTVLARLRNHDLHYTDQDAAWKLIETIVKDRDLWKARAFVLFWRLPDDAVVPIKKEEVERAKQLIDLYLP